MNFYPYKKGRAGNVLAILKGRGHNKVFRVVLTRVLEVSTILEGGTNVFYPLKGGGA